MIFSDIETYIEFIAGYRDAKGKQINYWPQPTISLATYDTGFVTSVAEQTITSNIAMSDRQASLAERLIAKYEKQLKKQGIEQPTHKNYRLGQRIVNRDSLLDLVDNSLHFRFPFDNKMIQDVKEFLKQSQGKVRWNKEQKAWIFALTEYNVNWATAYAQANKIAVSESVSELFNLILEAEKTPFAIELVVNNGKCEITNAPESMIEYIEEHIGFDDIYKLVDNAGVLGFTVGKDITDILENKHGPAFMKLCADRTINFVPKDRKSVEEENNMTAIIKWAIEVNRLPICVYNPNFLTPDLSIYQKYFKDEEIQQIGMKDLIELVDPNVKIIYTNKIISNWEGRMPLLITYANLNHGTTKQTFLAKAEKIIYYCQPLPKR